jgi:hypothetical protein
MIAQRTPRLRTPWTPEETERLRQCWHGSPLSEIARITGHNVAACEHKAWRLGLGGRLAPRAAPTTPPAAPAPDGEHRRKNQDGEVEKLCPRCNDWWPDDREFFNGQGGSRQLSSWCKACMLEGKSATRRARLAGDNGAAQGATA